MVGLAAGALGAAAAMHAAGWLPASAGRRWQRTSHAGAEVTLLEGPSWVAGSVAATAAATVARAPFRSGRQGRASSVSGVAPALVAVASGMLGAVDDLAGTTDSKGLRGHLRALARGKVTTGAMKIVGLALTGLAGVALVDGARRDAAAATGDLRYPLLETLVGGAVVAAAANVVNLFDLRPGRALKVVIALAGPVALRGSSTAASAVGASLGVLGPDLAGRAMLGDTGANAAGALVGLAFVERCGLPGRALALALLTGVTLASECVSFTEVIERNEILRRLDEWGRSPR